MPFLSFAIIRNLHGLRQFHGKESNVYNRLQGVAIKTTQSIAELVNILSVVDQIFI
jgi:hypothetical protein